MKLKYYVTTNSPTAYGLSAHRSKRAAIKAKNRLMGKGLKPTIRKWT